MPYQGDMLIPWRVIFWYPLVYVIIFWIYPHSRYSSGKKEKV